MSGEREIRQITAYISAYHVTRQFGGHEEGGWWYNDYEWLKVSIPFRALQDYRWDEDPDMEGAGYGEWKPYGPPRPADLQAEIQLAAHEFNLQSFFGEETHTRGSVLSHGDIEFVIERNPGERGELPRPRYE